MVQILNKNEKLDEKYIPIISDIQPRIKVPLPVQRIYQLA